MSNLFQFVTDRILVKQYFHVSDEQQQTTLQFSLDLTYEEASGLRYTAGYVCCTMRKKLGSKNPDMLECISELIDDTSGEEESSDATND